MNEVKSRKLNKFFPVCIILRCVGDEDLTGSLQGDPRIICYCPEYRRVGDHGVWILSFEMPASDKIRFQNDGMTRLDQKLERIPVWLSKVFAIVPKLEEQ